MKIKLILSFFLITIALMVTLVSCSYGINQDPKTAFLDKAFKQVERSSPSDLTVIRNGIKKEVATILCRRYDMECIGFSGGWCGNKILGLSFEIHRIIDKETARAMLIDCVQEFITKVNINEALKPYLEGEVFTEKNIDIKIFIEDSFGNEVYQPNISVCRSIEGEIAYCYNSPEKEYGYIATEHETFQQALSILEEQDKDSKQGSTQIASNDISLSQSK